MDDFTKRSSGFAALGPDVTAKIFRELSVKDLCQVMTVDKGIQKCLMSTQEMIVREPVATVDWKSIGRQFPQLKILRCVNKSPVSRELLQEITGAMPSLTSLYLNNVRLNNNVEKFSAEQNKILIIRQLVYKFARNYSRVAFTADCLPARVLSLNLGGHFNESIDEGVLPNDLRHLRFGTYFNKPLSKVLPDSLTHLFLGSRFDQDLVFLPNNLTHLKIGKNFQSQLSLPPSLKHLHFDMPLTEELAELIPDLTNPNLIITCEENQPLWVDSRSPKVRNHRM